jgi:type III secretion effector delivery regulator, TyeA family
LDLTDADWMSQQRLHNETQTLGLADGRGEISFFHELRELVWQIPPKAYAEPERRDKFVRAVQDALDTLIADEA